MGFCHAFMDALAKAIMGQEGVMEQRQRFSAEYKRKAMVMRDAQSLASTGLPGTRGHGGWDNRTRLLAMGAAQVFRG